MIQRERFSNQQTAYGPFSGMNNREANNSRPPDFGNFLNATASVFYVEYSTQEFHSQPQQKNNSSLWLLGEHIRGILSTDKPLPVYFGVPIDLLRLVLLLVSIEFIISQALLSCQVFN